MQHGELRSDRGSWFVIEFFLQFSLFNIHDTFKAGDWSSHIFLKLVYFPNHNCVMRQWDSRHKRRSTSIRSRSRPLRDCAISRRYACSSIAGKALRRTRIFIWVGQQPLLTKKGRHYLQNGKFSYLLSFEEYPPLVQVRHQHRHCRTHHQQDHARSEVTNSACRLLHQERSLAACLFRRPNWKYLIWSFFFFFLISGSIIRYFCTINNYSNQSHRTFESSCVCFQKIWFRVEIFRNDSCNFTLVSFHDTFSSFRCVWTYSFVESL